jgi:hypothetical protein
VWPALEAIARGRPMADVLHLVDTPAEATALVAPSTQPRTPDGGS